MAKKGMSIIILLLILLIVGLIAHMFGRLPESVVEVIDPPVSPGRFLEKNAPGCLAGAMLADSAKEAPDVRAAVMKEIGRSVLRYHDKYGTEVCTIFEDGLAMIPPGFKRNYAYLGRRTWYVRDVEVTANVWAEALKIAEELIAESTAGCATHYIRAPRAWQESKQALSGLRAMTPAETTPGAEIKFFCP